MRTLRMLLLLSFLGGLTATALVWSHDHPHDFWSPWVMLDLVAVVVLVGLLKVANRLMNAEPPATRTAAVLAERHRTS